MSASIDMRSDNILQSALEYRRREFLNELPLDLSLAERQLRWNAYVISLSSPSTAVSDTRHAYSATACAATGHVPPTSTTPPPETKRRRLVCNRRNSEPFQILKMLQNSEVSHHAPKLSITTQYSQPQPANHVAKFDEGSSPFVKIGAPVAAPLLRQQSTQSQLEHTQDSSHMVPPFPISHRRGSSASQNRRVSVQEYDPVEFFGSSTTPISATSSSMGHVYHPSFTAPQSSRLQSSSSQSSFGEMSLGASTNPTSISMSRLDSAGGSSFQKSFDMMRVSSTTSPDNQHMFSTTSPMESQRQLEFTSSQGLSSQSINPAHDISQTGAQFANHDAVASAPAMERRKSSTSRQLHPKRAVSPVSPAISRTSSAATEATSHEIVRVPSEDGSYIKEAIQISPTTSYIKPKIDKVKCTFPGCNSRPRGFKGVHEMQRHYDRDHTPERRVYVCAPLAEDPTFLSKSNCKHCETLKCYNEDYNAGEHLRRMHFNPKPPKVRRGKLAPEERRGGKGGGTEPPMPVLRKYMFSYVIDADGKQISKPEKVDPSSSIMIPHTSFNNQPCALGMEAFTTASSSSAVPKIEPTEGSSVSETMYATNVSPDPNPFHLKIPVDEPQVRATWDINGGGNAVEVPNFVSPPFDPTSPAIDTNNDPVFFESNRSDDAAPFIEFHEIFSAFESSSM